MQFKYICLYRYVFRLKILLSISTLTFHVLLSTNLMQRWKHAIHDIHIQTVYADSIKLLRNVVILTCVESTRDLISVQT